MADHNEEKENSGNKKHKQGGMAMRGVSRPMAEKQMQSEHSESHKEDEHKHDKNGHHEMDRDMMLNMHYNQTLWIYWSLIVLGVWMLVSPLTFSYGQFIAQPPGGRELWLSDTMRVSVMRWSDIISGALLIIFGWRSLKPDRPISLWICCFVGIWLNMAPVIFWAPSLGIYINDTVVGALVIALSILIPGMPNMIKYMKMGSEVPQGWSYNPSSWPQRWSMMVLAFLGWIVSRYLGAYQLGYLETIWDPFFGPQSAKVLTSKMSESLPVSDGALGALAYTFEFLMGWMGAPSRWRTMPWMVTFFGILVIPLGLVHILLVISQPVVVGAWCTMCLLAAAIMLPMLPLEVDEVFAMVQHMKKATREKGARFWTVFWKGGKPAEKNMDERTPALMSLPDQPGKVIKASLWGMSSGWTLMASTLIGIWLMFTPALFGVSIETRAADVNHLGGSLIVVTSVIAMGEILRRGRYLNMLLGLIVAILPWFLPESNTALNLSGLLSGIAVILLSIPRGPKTQTYGIWESWVK